MISPTSCFCFDLPSEGVSRQSHCVHDTRRWPAFIIYQASPRPTSPSTSPTVAPIPLLSLLPPDALPDELVVEAVDDAPTAPALLVAFVVVVVTVPLEATNDDVPRTAPVASSPATWNQA